MRFVVLAIAAAVIVPAAYADSASLDIRFDSRR
jgi:hypothetical protein